MLCICLDESVRKLLCVESPLLPLETGALARLFDDGVGVTPLAAADVLLPPIKLPMLLLPRALTPLLAPAVDDLVTEEGDSEDEDEEAGALELRRLRLLRTPVVWPDAPDLMVEPLCGLELACVRVVTDELLVLPRL